MANRPAHEEDVLYLVIELDQALARKTPQWTPQQMDVARRWLASLSERLLAICPGRDGAAVTGARAVAPLPRGSAKTARELVDGNSPKIVW
jgi:hypothetical protein